MLFTRRLATALTLAPFTPAAHAATDRNASKAVSVSHRVAIHINYRDPAAVNLALNNVQNLYDYFREKNEGIEVRVVTHGQGLHMLREDTSAVQDRLRKMRSELASLTFAACANTRRNMEKEEGHPVPLLSMADVVPSGVVELVLLEERGWRYLRP